MFAKSGSDSPVLRRHRSGGATLAVILFLLHVTCLPSQARAEILLTLGEAERLALEAEPGIEAIAARASALRAQAAVAGELPDPKVRLGLNNYPFQSGGFTTEGMTHVAVALRQDFPAGRTLALAEEQFDLRAEATALGARARERNVLTSARSAWLEAFYWERARQLVELSKPYFDDLATITRSLYSVGRRNQQDVLRAELELSRIDDRLIEIDRQRETARSDLREWIGRAANRPLPESLPPQPAVPPLADMQSALDLHPVIQSLDTDIEAREKGVSLAEQRSRPGWAVDLGYSYRDGTLADGTPRSDFVSLNVTLDLPFFSRDAIDGTLTAALEERSAARASREQTLREYRRRLDAEYARWRQLGKRLDLYDQRILNQTEEHAEAALLAYQNDRSDFADVMRAYVDDLNTRIEFLRLQVDRARSVALLANLGGFPR